MRYRITFEIEGDADLTALLEAAQTALPVMVLAAEDAGSEIVQATEDDVVVEVMR
jgi:hypothetical protein